MAGALFARYYVLAHSPAAARVARIEAKAAAIKRQLDGLEANVSAHPQDAKARWELVDAYQHYYVIEKAIPHFEALIRMDPSAAAPRIALGNIRLAGKDYAAAEAVFRETIEKQPKSLEAWQGLAAALYHQRRYLESSKVAHKAIVIYPKEPNSRFIYASSLLEYAVQYPDPENYDAALKAARDNFLLILAAWPENGEVYHRLGRAYLNLRDARQATKFLRRAMELLPDNSEIPRQLTYVFLRSGDRKAARTLAEEALVRFPKDAGLHNVLARLLQTSGEPGASEKALDHFARAVQLAPKSEANQETYGAACLRMGKLQEARNAFETAISLDPNRAFPYQQLAVVYTRLGDPAKASTAARISVQMVANDQRLIRLQTRCRAEPSNVKLHMVLARRYLEIGNVTGARDEYISVLRFDPKNAEAHAAVAQIIRNGS